MVEDVEDLQLEIEEDMFRYRSDLENGAVHIVKVRAGKIAPRYVAQEIRIRTSATNEGLVGIRLPGSGIVDTGVKPPLSVALAIRQGSRLTWGKNDGSTPIRICAVVWREGKTTAPGVERGCVPTRDHATDKAIGAC